MTWRFALAIFLFGIVWASLDGDGGIPNGSLLAIVIRSVCTAGALSCVIEEARRG